MMLKEKVAQPVLFKAQFILNKQTNISYLDYNATTPLDQRVLDSMLPFFRHDFANSSSSHHFGQRINDKVQQARMQVADLIHAQSNEIVFTSGATEAISIVLNGIAESYLNKGNHLITVSTEHKAVLDTCKKLEQKGFEITFLTVDQNGLIDLDELIQAIRPDTILISVMFVNNETGVIQPIEKIASIAQKNKILLMSDATQAVGKVPLNVTELGIDLLCFSGHKMYGPKGIGALFMSNRAKRELLATRTTYGGQEQGLRSGTLNVPGIIGLGKACEIAEQEMSMNQARIIELRDSLESELMKLPNTFLNGDQTNRIYNTTNIGFRGHDANVLIGRMKTIAVSNGSACSSSIIEPSHVLRSMGLTDEDAFSSLRFSLGRFNTKEEIENVVLCLKVLIQSDIRYA